MLDKLREANITRQIEWQNGKDLTIEYRGNELAGEAGELCNLLKKVARERIGLRGTRANITDLKKEIGDVLVCLDLIANDLGLHLDECVEWAFNSTSEKYELKTFLEP